MAKACGMSSATVNRIWRAFGLQHHRMETFKLSADPLFIEKVSGLGERMLELLLAGLSTRSYGKAIGQMAETAGVSKSSVSRQAAEAAGARLKELAERRLDDRDYLIVYVDGIQFGGHHVLAVEKQHPDAAGSLREGLGELFTVSEIGLTPAPRRCLGTTNVIDNAHSGMRRRTGRGYRRIMGYRDLWILKAHLDEPGTPPVVRKGVAS